MYSLTFIYKYISILVFHRIAREFRDCEDGGREEEEKNQFQSFRVILKQIEKLGCTKIKLDDERQFFVYTKTRII